MEYGVPTTETGVPGGGGSSQPESTSVHGFEETEEFLLTSLSYMHEALQLMPAESKKDYLEAVRKDAKLVQRESDPVKFLRCEDFNPWAASRRFVRYWQSRRRLFGNRWLLPLVAEPGGALEDKDLELLHSGFMTVVSGGSSSLARVLLIDRSKLIPNSEGISKHRMVFFLLSETADETAQRYGISLVRCIPSGTEPRVSEAGLRHVKLGLSMVISDLPLRLRHTLFLQREADKKGFVMSHFTNSIMKLVAEKSGLVTPQMITVQATEDAAKKLKEFGIPPECIPVSHGGLWTPDRLLEWKEGIANKSAPSVPAFWMVSQEKGTPTAPTLSSGAGHKGQDHISRVSPVQHEHKRRKRFHYQVERDVRKLQKEQTALAKEHRRLDDLLLQAKHLVTMRCTFDV
jgi:hypothetical protein